MASETPTSIKLKVEGTAHTDLPIELDVFSDLKIRDLKDKIEHAIGLQEIDKLFFKVVEMQDDEQIGDYVTEENATIALTAIHGSADPGYDRSTERKLQRAKSRTKVAKAINETATAAVIIHGTWDNFQYHPVQPNMDITVKIKGNKLRRNEIIGKVYETENLVPGQRIFHAKRYKLPEVPNGTTIGIRITNDGVEGPNGPLGEEPVKKFREIDLKSQNAFDRNMPRAQQSTALIGSVIGMIGMAAVL